MNPMKKTCLLIDDDIDDQEIFALALSKINFPFDCIFANNGLEALKSLDQKTILPDYIFLDLNMPRMNGKECLAELKKNERLRHIPVVIYSTSSSLLDINDTRELGAKDFIIKPFSLTELTEKLEAFFRKQPEFTGRHAEANNHGHTANYNSNGKSTGKHSAF
jgi:CheY-like chemotaxis protein